MPKAKKKNIKVRDLKPKKDAKGGVMHRYSTSTGTNKNASQLGSSNITSR